MEHHVDLSGALSLIREIPDFPAPGVLFRDITPLIGNPEAFSLVAKELARSKFPYEKVVGIEARGFILGSAMAIDAKCGFVPLRKSGKLPHVTFAKSYGLEYGTDVIEVHIDALAQNEKVLLVDDVLATGGTLIAGIELMHELGAVISEVVVLLEISALGGRDRILRSFPDINIRTLVAI
jgi:adenine phosphoribosyltransferase